MIGIPVLGGEIDGSKGHSLPSAIQVGPVTVPNRVFLAPMSGITDTPFRRLAERLGAGLVVSEMTAGAGLVRGEREARVRSEGSGVAIHVVQLAGCEARWMAEGARIAEAQGAHIIDINMGCPSRQVTNGASGSALMRDLDHALTLIEATVGAVNVPVTLKMRLGWDHDSINAPALGRRAEDAGVRMITVHGRTRCQFYTGKADWQAIAKVRAAISVPLIANGDGVTASDARAMLLASGADGIMIGRGAYGRPWWPGVIAEALDPGSGIAEPGLEAEGRMVSRHHDAILTRHGHHHGNRLARKHVGWVIERLHQRRIIGSSEAQDWRARLLRISDNAAVARGLSRLYAGCQERKAA